MWVWRFSIGGYMNKNKNKENYMKKKTWIIGISVVFLLIVISTRGFGMFGSDSNLSSTNVTPSSANSEPPPSPYPGSPSLSQPFPSLVPDGDLIRISLSEITDEAQWYTYKGKTLIRFFVVKAGNGSIKAGFDACDVCYRSQKGYSQDGEFMVCNNCGLTYPISDLGTENKNPGGCWPGYLPTFNDGEYLLIKVQDLEARGWMF